MMCALDRRLRHTRPLDLVSAAIADTLTTPDGRLIVVLPPQVGKSLTGTIGGALWDLHRDPRQRIILASYSHSLAHRMGRQIRNLITMNGAAGTVDVGLRLAPDQRAKHEWELTAGGGLYATGVGGSLTGRPADAAFIDDPLKGRREADSQIMRDALWDWWESVLSSRLAPGAPVVLTLTRWHYDDLAGRLMREQPGVWRLLHVPAQADPGIVDPDPLGRAPGEYLEDARGRTVAQWEARKRDAGDEWVPLHQGAPQAPGGQMFEVDRLRYWRRDLHGTGMVTDRPWRLDDCWRFLTVDTATSVKSSADYTVASAWAVTPSSQLVLLDVRRERVPEHRQIDLAAPLVDRWRPEATYVEPSLRGTLLIRDAVAAGWTIRDLRPDTGKTLRAAPAARRVADGVVWFPDRHRHLEAVVEELRQFPAGRHDDFVDTLSYAALVAFQHHVPPGTRVPQVDPVGVDPYESAVVGSPLDYQRASW
jgi:predicted phage terminase large subunit-like protein